METKIEGERGCGYRKKGGMYLVSDGISSPCYALPIEVSVCPHCGNGIKQGRGWTWLSWDLIKALMKCKKRGCSGCVPFNGEFERIGLMWVGRKYYTPGSYQEEAARMGVSKRISQIPKDFKVGRDWVLLAHAEAIERPVVSTDPEDQGRTTKHPGIFYAFKPTRIEYICRGDESDEELERLKRRKITPINVIPDNAPELMNKYRVVKDFALGIKTFYDGDIVVASVKMSVEDRQTYIFDEVK